MAVLPAHFQIEARGKAGFWRGTTHFLQTIQEPLSNTDPQNLSSGRGQSDNMPCKKAE